MHWTILVAVLVLFLPRAAALQDANTTLALLPSCAIGCLTTAAADNACTASNMTCLCDSMTLAEQASRCLQTACTAKQIFIAKNATATACHNPRRNRAHVFTTTSTTLGVLTGAFVLVRCAHRLCLARKRLAADDWLCLIATVAGVPATVINRHGLAANGLGRDVWTLPSATVYRFGRFLYVMEVIYFVDSALLKIALLVFYLRIFPAPGVRRVLWATVAGTALFGAVFVLLAVCQCRPVSYYWTRWDDAHTGVCLNINAVAWVHAVIGIAVDLWMLAIPLWQLRGLRLHWKKKVGVALMLCVGTFVTVVSILRLQSLLHFAHLSNTTWEDYDIANWSTIEINVGIICSCMPAVRLVLVHYFPALLGASSKDAYQHSMHSLHQAYARSRPLHSTVSASTQHVHDVTIEHKTSLITPQPSRNSQGILFTKSFAVEYGADDLARLVT